MSSDSEPQIDAALLARLEHLDLSLRRLAHGAPSGDHAAARRGSGLLFREHRAYSVGDDPRRLDWNVYLRLGELLVKEHEAEESPRLLLVLDCSASMAMEPQPKFTVARELALCMGAIALMRRVLVTCAEIPATLEPTNFSGRSALPALLRRTQSLRAGAGKQRAAALADSRRAGMALCITDLFDDATDGTVRMLAARRCEVHVLHLRDAADLSPPLGEQVRLRDAESAEELRVCLDASTRRAWRTTLEEHFAARTQALTALGAVVSAFEVSEGAEGILMQLARRGTLLH